MFPGKNKAKIYMENDVPVRFEDAAGVDEAKQELVEVIDFLEEPSASRALAGRYRAAFFWWARPAPAKRCWQRPLPAKVGFPFSV